MAAELSGDRARGRSGFQVPNDAGVKQLRSTAKPLVADEGLFLL